jgi:hypothetical protein
MYTFREGDLRRETRMYAVATVPDRVWHDQVGRRLVALVGAGGRIARPRNRRLRKVSKSLKWKPSDFKNAFSAGWDFFTISVVRMPPCPNITLSECHIVRMFVRMSNCSNGAQELNKRLTYRLNKKCSKVEKILYWKCCSKFSDCMIGYKAQFLKQTYVPELANPGLSKLVFIRY